MTHSATTAARLGARVCLCGILTVLAGGCGLSSITSGLGSSIFGSSSSEPAAPPAVNEEQLLSAAKSAGDNPVSPAVGEIAHGCPRLSVPPRGSHLTIYEDGRAGDGLAIMHRGEITKTARECQIEPGRVTVKYGFSGRVLLGPRGSGGNIVLPVNIVVTDSKREKVTTDTVSGRDRRRHRQPDRLLLDRAHGDLRYPGGIASGRVRGVRRLRPERQGRRLTLSAAAPTRAADKIDLSENFLCPRLVVGRQAASSACRRDRECSNR